MVLSEEQHEQEDGITMMITKMTSDQDGQRYATLFHAAFASALIVVLIPCSLC
jgi:hypothetical protein